MVEKNFIDWSIYGKCLQITDGAIELIVTVDVGPRVVFFGKKGGKNLFFNDLKDEIHSRGIYFDTNFKKGEAWHIYGGHRLWKSPEEFSTYAPDNYPVDVELLSNGAVFTAPVEKMTGLEKQIKIKIKDDGSVKVTHSFINKGTEAVSASIWALSVMDKGGTVYIPLSVEDTGWLANRNLVFWSYTDINDKRLSIRQDGAVLRQDANATSNLKIGTQSPSGEVYFIAGDTMFKKSFDRVENGNYPDFSCNLECYTSPLMTEIESLSEFVTLLPEQKIKHREYWRLFESDSAEYAEIAAKIK